MAHANPFYRIFENSIYIHARTLRTNFLRKMGDTFLVYSGWIYGKKGHVGIFDYATLMIPYFFDHVALWSWNYAGSNPIATISVIPATLIFVVTNAVRFISAAVFTLLMSPIVGIVHGLSQIKGNALKKIVASVILDKEETQKKNDEQSKRQGAFKWYSDLKLGDYLEENNENLESLRVHATGNYTKLKLEFHVKRPAYVAQLYKHTVDLDLTNSEDSNALDALLNLNVGGLARKLEKINAQFRFFRSANSGDISEDKRAVDKQINLDTRQRKK